VSEARLTRPVERLGGVSVAEATHTLATWSVSAQGLAHPVPRLHPLASGDQLSVVGTEFLDWVGDEPGRRSHLAEWRDRIDQLRAAV
jgi:hypothetical protein